MRAHTPGPWTVERRQEDGWNQDDWLVVFPDGEDASVLNEPNARLIAAGPDLLAAAELSLLFHGSGPWDGAKRARWREITGTDEATTKVMCDTIRAALRKANGEGN